MVSSKRIQMKEGKGSAIVHFDTVFDARKAIACSGKYLGERQIVVEFSKRTREELYGSAEGPPRG